MDETRCVAVLEVIADLKKENEVLRYDYTKSVAQVEHLDKVLKNSYNEVYNLNQILDSIKADLETALSENVVLEKKDIEKLLNILREGM